MKTFSIGDKKIRYTARWSGDSSYAHLKFRGDLVLEITLPMDSDIKVQVLLEKKRQWIEMKLEALMSRKAVFDDGRVLFRGKYYDLRIRNSPKRKAGTVAVGGPDIQVFVGGQRDAREVLAGWMKEKTANYARRKARVSAKRHGIQVGHVMVKDTKRWGYCRRNGDIVLNWQLIALPRKLAEYVILHELAHLSEFSHSKGFRARLAAMCPDYKEREKELKDYYSSEPVKSVKT